MKDIKPTQMSFYKKMGFYVWGIVLIMQISYSQSMDTKLDPSIRYGRLDNGLSYFIRNVENTSEKIDMRLYVKVGHSYQKEDQLDFAHALEHLAFKCARHFPVNLLDDPELLSRLGMNESNITARTAPFYTRYYFDVPSNRMDALDEGLLWFHDISDLELTLEKINSERGPLREEVVFRTGSRLQEEFNTKSMESQICSCMSDFSDFFEHNRQFSPESLRAFYTDWYLPDRMAIVMVGDITDMTEIENKIKGRFSDIANRPSPEWSECREKYLDHPDQFTLVIRNVDGNGEEDVSSDFHFYMRDGNFISQRKDWEGVQRTVVWDMLSKLINNRFSEANMDYNTSFSIFSDSPSEHFPAYHIRVVERKGNEQQAVEKTVRIIHQAKKYGFGQKEWDRTKKEQLEAIKNSDTTQSAYWMDQIEKYYVYGELLPKNKRLKLNQWLSALSLKEFNTLAKQFLLDRPNDIGIIAPPGKTYTESQVRGWINQALQKKVIPYLVPEIPKQLLTVTELSNLKEVGYENLDSVAPIPVLKNARILRENMPKETMELVLQNGVKVVLDTSRLNNNRVYLHGYSPKGASCFPKQDYFSAINATAIIKNAGAGMLDKFQIDRFLAETSFWQGVHPYIEDTETGIKGNAALDDLEKLLQLVYLYFVKPRADKTAFEDWKSEERKRYLNPTYSIIKEDFDVQIREFVKDNSKVPQGTKRFYGISKTDMERAYEIYQKLYGNAKDFTFLVSGDFSVDLVLPLVQKYLGNLPESHVAISCSLDGMEETTSQKKPFYQEFSAKELGGSYKMKSVQYCLKFMFKAEDPRDWKEHIKMDALGTLMNSKISELRYSQELALFNPMVWSEFNRKRSSYNFEMELEFEEEKLEVLRNACKQMISEVKRESFTKERFAEVMQNGFLGRNIVKQKSRFQRLQQLYRYYVYGESWLDPVEVERYIKSLTPRDIQEAAKTYLRDENMMEFVMQDDENP